ncbi:hypothetical protein [Streptomyces sp. 150FB]|uniref:hypothetical protein n=1 Tax=Streptomyces sp. 150FB TaxID=1576605 RepID=UPI0006969531|nr:hypothetical protein [Streptomyces sp. 150FB]
MSTSEASPAKKLAHPVSGGLHRAELRGRAAGTGVMSLFALGWTATGISPLPIGPGRVVFGVAVVISVVCVVLAVRMSRAAANAPTAADTAPDGAGFTDKQKKALGRTFGFVVLAEWVGVFIIAAVLGRTGHSDAIPAVIALAVGVHFFPLARLFHVAGYWITGGALCLFALAGLALAPLTSTPALWTLLPGFGSALSLYVTCGYLLRARTS